MRQRKIKDIENKLLDYSDLIIKDPASHKGSWREFFASSLDTENADKSDDKSSPLLLEIGCGKGRFISTLASENPKNNYLAVEGFSSVIIRAAQKIKKEELSNVFLIQEFVYDLGTWFDAEELDGIYLNFSDPWPKKKNAKRRLTYRDRLEQYTKTLVPGGFISIKTDNDDFFEFTLEEIDLYNQRRESLDGKMVLKNVIQTDDLYNSEWVNTTPATEYELKFVESGKNIHYVKLLKD